MAMVTGLRGAPGRMTRPTTESLRQARADLAAVIKEIRAVRGFESFLGRPTVSDVSAAATEPLAYLAAARDGGLGLVVRGSDITTLELPALTREALSARTQRYLSAYADYRADPVGHRVAWNDELEAITAWLWTDVMGPLLELVQDEARLWIVPGGLLGLFPLHAAWREVKPTIREYALDRLEINYAPSAQALVTARSAVTAPIRHLLAVAPDPTRSGPDRLPLAVPEAYTARRAFPLGPPVQVSLTSAELVTEMAAADVVHFACHGLADLESPLDSGIVLGPDAVLQLRDLMPLDLGIRLVVLSACETLLPGTELPDEVLALPSGLLQSGVAGVIASSWVVPDLPSAVVMVEFYRRWRHPTTESPAAALREAQIWVRDSPIEEKLALYEAASRGANDWPDPVVADQLLDELLTDPALSFDLVGWAAYAYVGA